MGLGATEVLLGDGLVEDGLDDLRAGNKAVRRVAYHHGEVSDGGTVDGATSARSADKTDLRDDTRGFNVALKDFSVATEGGNTLLDTGTTGVVDADDGCADFEGLVHDLADLLGMGLRKGSTKDGKVLGEDEDRAAVDVAVAGDNTVAVVLLLLHAKVRASVELECVVFGEGSCINKERNALASSELSLGVLLLDTLLAAAQECLGLDVIPAIGKRDHAAQAARRLPRLAEGRCCLRSTHRKHPLALQSFPLLLLLLRKILLRTWSIALSLSDLFAQLGVCSRPVGVLPFFSLCLFPSSNASSLSLSLSLLCPSF